MKDPQISMLEEHKGIYRIPCFPENMLAAFSGREFPREKQSEFLGKLGIQPEKLCRVRQVHGDRILVLDKLLDTDSRVEADGMATDQGRLALGILTADCIPIFFADPVRRVCGIAHGGWKGIRAGIAGRMVAVMKEHFYSRASDIFVGFGPSICRLCYEVGPEFAGFFPGFYSRRSTPDGAERGYLDLSGAAKAQLIHAGIEGAHFWDCGLCTHCQNQRFYSARREKNTAERILSVIMIRENAGTGGS